MRRREFLGVLSSAATWPLAARAQQAERVRRIGVLMGYAESDPEAQAWVATFREELQKLGWTEGRNIWIDFRWATGGDAESTQRFAKELVALQPDLILSNNTPTTAALLQQSRTIPIIFALVNDPVSPGFVASFPRPGGNVTGFSTMEPTMSGKWLELLKEIAPRVARVAGLFNPATVPHAEFWLDPFRAAARSFAVQAIAAPVHDRSELESIIATQAREPNGGLVVMPGAFMTAHRAEVTSLAARYRLPAISPYRFYTELGGLLSYGYDSVDNFRRAASYADRILKGAKPSELPVQAPVKFELVINLKTAKALGIAMAQTVLPRADEVIELKRREFITLLDCSRLRGWSLCPLITASQRRSSARYPRQAGSGQARPSRRDDYIEFPHQRRCRVRPPASFLFRSCLPSWALLHSIASPSTVPAARVCFWRMEMRKESDAKLSQEVFERMWFRRVAALLMIGMMCVGAVPLLKNTLYPVQRNR